MTMQIDPQTDANIVPTTPPQRCKHAPPVGQSSILTKTVGILMNIECVTKIDEDGINRSKKNKERERFLFVADT